MISILLATTGRPQKARRCVQGILTTTTGHDIEIVAAVDHDPDTRETLRPLVDKLLYEDEYRGCSKAWNDALAASQGEHVVLAADDLIWHPRWLDAALAALEHLPGGYGLVGFNDGHWRDELSTHYLVSRRFILEHLGGRIAWEHYAHSFNDAEINDRARAAGRYVWCEEAHVTHEHWLFGDRAQDPTDQRNLGAHPDSHRAYEQRKAAGFPDDLQAVIEA